MSTTPRRPMVPGPSAGPSTSAPPAPPPRPGGIAERAVQSREGSGQTSGLRPGQNIVPSTNGGRSATVPTAHGPTAHGPTPALRELPHPQFPVTGVGNIAGAIASVMANVGTIHKGGYNKFHNYNYARMEDLLVAITPLIGKAGLAIVQNEVERTVLEGNRLAVTYEFSIFHASGEVWPQQPRFTGMAIARDSKGGWDDKAINKCHTNARKYFLLALFQVPAGDFEESDAGPPQPQKRESVPGPGPSSSAPQQAKEQAQPEQPQGPNFDDPMPRRIGLGQGAGPEVWAGIYTKFIERAGNEAEIRGWDTANDQTLQALSEKYPDIYAMIEAAVQRRLDQVGSPRRDVVPGPDGPDVAGSMPDIKQDTQGAMNWIAQRLLDCRTFEAAQAFWNKVVAPVENQFDEVDWGLLMKEWERTEARLNPPDDASDDAMNQENPPT